MADDTLIISKDQSGKTVEATSSLFGVSVRAWVIIMLVIGLVTTHLLVTAATLYHAIVSKDFGLVGTLTTIGEPYYTVIGIAVGFYFGQKDSGVPPKTPKP